MTCCTFFMKMKVMINDYTFYAMASFVMICALAAHGTKIWISTKIHHVVEPLMTTWQWVSLGLEKYQKGKIKILLYTNFLTYCNRNSEKKGETIINSSLHLQILRHHQAHIVFL